MGVVFVKEVGFKPEVKERGGYGCTECDQRRPRLYTQFIAYWL